MSNSVRKGFSKCGNPRTLHQSLQRSFIDPSALLEQLNIAYENRGRWLQVYCPFHKDGKEAQPSLSMNSEHGYYKCHACGAKGGDIIAFYRGVTGLSFTETLLRLEVFHG